MNLLRWYFLLNILVMMNSSYANQAMPKEPWTWFYSQKFSGEYAAQFHDKTSLCFLKSQTPAFSQLILSFNANRPKNGHFSFWVQVRIKERWQELHHMLDWGNQIQRSHCTIHPQSTSCHHVRLETPKYNHADAFRIIIKPHNGANLTDLKALFVSVSDFSKFSSEYSYEYGHHLKSVKVEGVPRQSQMMVKHPDAERICSPTSMSMLTGYLNQTIVDPAHFADQAYDVGLDSYGSWPFNIAHAYEVSQGNMHFWVSRLSSFDDLHNHLMRGIPVIVSVRGQLEGGVKPYNNGHLMVVIGWDAKEKKVICHDPAFSHDEKTEVKYPISSFLRAWEQSHRLAYLAEPLVGAA